MKHIGSIDLMTRNLDELPELHQDATGDSLTPTDPAAAPGALTTNTTPPPGTLVEKPRKKKKKSEKIESAWISFVGRIVAQFIGAAASVILGLVLLSRYQASNDPGGNASATPSAGTSQERVTPVRARRHPGEPALVVLPLANFSGDARHDSFADGMTEELTANLSQLKGLRVISRTSAMYYKGRQQSLPEIARALDVDLLVEGSVVRDGDRVRITAQLIDAATDEHLWARSYERTIGDVVRLQGEVAAAIARDVGAAVARPEQDRLTAWTLADPAVYDPLSSR